MNTLYTILHQNKIQYKDHGVNVGKDFINICCPFCHESRYHCGIHADNLWFKCFVCGESGGHNKLSYQLNKHYPDFSLRAIAGTSTHLFLNDLTEKPTAHSKKLYRSFTKEDYPILRWLTTMPSEENLHNPYRTRGIGLDLIEQINIAVGINSLNGYLVFKEYENLVARKFTDQVDGSRWFKSLKTKPYLFGIDYVKKTQPPAVIITEGIFDSLRLPLGRSIALLGTSLSNQALYHLIDILKHTERVLIALDRFVDDSVVDNLYFALTDLKHDVKRFDWSLIGDKSIKDLDELYLAFGSVAFKGCLNTSLQDYHKKTTFLYNDL